MNFAIAVKSFIVQDGNLLVLKRRGDDSENPLGWEFPGGRLNPGEDPLLGLKREVMEEAGIDIDIIRPLNVRHFTRNDGQTITMIIFLCRAAGTDVKISDEHIAAEWIPVKDSKKRLAGFFHQEVDMFMALSKGLNN